jgi:hypothetical protein
MKCVKCSSSVKKEDKAVLDGWWQCEEYEECQYFICKDCGWDYKTDYRTPKEINANPDYFALNTVHAKCEDE